MEKFFKHLKQIAACVVALSFSAFANADVILDTWNVDDIQASDDYVNVVIGSVFLGLGEIEIEHTTMTVTWIEDDVTDDLWTAIGIDKIFYNTTEFIGVLQVWEGGAETTDAWSLNVNPDTAGGGFGVFLSFMNHEAGGNGGITPNSIMFILDGVATFESNSSGGTFAAHVRYGNDCSGWVSDGSTSSDTSEPSGCEPSKVPEPNTLALLGLGLIGIGLSRRRRVVTR